jgi:hypothetical protein
MAFIPLFYTKKTVAFDFSKLDIFFKKNEEVICPVHLLTYLLKLYKMAPSVFWSILIEKNGFIH